MSTFYPGTTLKQSVAYIFDLQFVPTNIQVWI
jgi:hypothetical protein